jgi:SAM-dependent methyltransferase
MNNRSSLIRVVLWARQLVDEVVGPGDLVVDLTAGTGRDTLHLFQCVGPRGRVLAFDIQEAALLQSAARLAAAGATVDFWTAPSTVGVVPPGVHLIRDSHARLPCYLGEAPRAVVANLGYLPGGDRTVVTVTESTLLALSHALELLAAGGRMTVALYVGHPGGMEEAQRVEAMFRDLPPACWDVLRLQVISRPGSPFLLVAEKRPDPSSRLRTTTT